MSLRSFCSPQKTRGVVSLLLLFIKTSCDEMSKFNSLSRPDPIPSFRKKESYG
jgi:hypothetical protein